MAKNTVYEQQARELGLLSMKEAAALVGTSAYTLVWYRRHSKSHGLNDFPPGTELGSRIFYTKEEILDWHANRPTQRGKRRASWPPPPKKFLANSTAQVLRPTAKQFPDDGSKIPVATNPTTGKTIAPKWRSCIGCGTRFISIGPGERFACSVPEAARGKPHPTTCVSRNGSGMSNLAD